MRKGKISVESRNNDSMVRLSKGPFAVKNTLGFKFSTNIKDRDHSLLPVIITAAIWKSSYILEVRESQFQHSKGKWSSRVIYIQTLQQSPELVQLIVQIRFLAVASSSWPHSPPPCEQGARRTARPWGRRGPGSGRRLCRRCTSAPASPGSAGWHSLRESRTGPCPSGVCWACKKVNMGKIKTCNSYKHKYEESSRKSHLKR